MNKLVLLLLHHNIRTPEALEFINKMDSDGISVTVLDHLHEEVDNTALYLCDDQTLIRALESKTAAVIGCELDSTLSCENIATDIWALDAEYLKERYDFITENSHCYYTTDDFTFCSPDYTTYRELFRLHTQEAYYLPENLKTYTEEDLKNHYRTLRLRSQLDELVRPYCIQNKLSGQIIGNIALSERIDCESNDSKPNDFIPRQYTLDYYIRPDYRGHGYATKAIRQFLAQLAPSSPISLTAEVHKNNQASHRALAKLREDGFLLPTYSKGERLVYTLDELLSN